MQVTDQHQLRGYMVDRREPKEIQLLAAGQFWMFRQYNITAQLVEKMIDVLAIEQDIGVRIERNADWDRQHTRLKQGESKPSEKTITLPKRIFDRAVKGDAAALEVFFHEIGHVVLEHKPIYMKSDGYVVTALDDAEEQADYFAKALMAFFGITVPMKEPVQYSLF